MKTFKGMIVVLIMSAACVADDDRSTPHAQIRKPEALADQWELVGEAINEPGRHIWGSSPIRTDDGKVHLFTSRWPVEAGFVPGWYTHCEIAHYVANRPEGPFSFVDIVVKGRGVGWDRLAPHNPNIQRVGKRYVLTYIANGGEPLPASQAIGMLLADSVDGPWKPANGDPDKPMLAPPDDPAIWCYKSPVGVNNPALLVHPDGRYLLYFKAGHANRPRNGVSMGVAVATRLEGPYVIQPEPITKNKKIIEDGYAFHWRDHICLMTTDNHGILERGGGLLWISKDGSEFEGPLAGFPHFGKHFFPDGVPANAAHHYGRQVKCERPQILMIENEPAYLYAPSKTAIDGSDGTNCYLFRRSTKTGR